jgi:Zn-dependent M28 family amino/carboxypeptidase
MLRNAPPAIHNGADDNASGTAAMLELARLLSKSKIRSSNFMFIGFSGEELGLFGSKFFVENPTIPLSTVNYMINMDMIGRLNDSSKTVTIGGYGTSPNWNPILMTIKNTELKLKFDSSGTGPSDHTSFYRKDIPVLFFFTGLHTDYHRPSDDVDKINFMGTTFIVKYIMSLIQKSQDHGKLVFSKTREQQSTTSARFTVSLGIMPDYTFSGSGVRIDGVSDGRPAKLAGIITGDILINIAGIPITSVESYMQILSKFKKGDSVKVVFRRGADEKTVNIIF